ncbi:MAG: PEP-CTERM sorting domain-containing protein [Opitutaceae bacterium]|nr:PEP-CTERM sorting domain-containing protein [Opitutaceae bacterium]
MKFFHSAYLALLAVPVFCWGGGVVVNRPTLNGLLGGSAYTETFESGFITLPSGGALTFGINLLDSSSMINSQGPNIVGPGVRFTGTNLQWDDLGYYSAPSREILFNGNTLTIDFTSATSAFGLDVRNFSGFLATMDVTIYATNDTTVLNTFTGITITHPPIFFGYQDAGGIGRVTFKNLSNGWSPIIDNLTFAAIPEPSIPLLLGAGLVTLMIAVRRRRVDSSG